MLNKNYINFLKKQNILILGATPRSGISIANVIYDINKSENININYALSDSKEKEKLNLKDLKDKNAKLFLGNQNSSIINDITLIITSPGIPQSISLIKEAKKRKIKIIGEIEFAYNLLPKRNYIAITGTDGKTTTVNLIYNIISSYKKARLLGNVGNTFSKEIENIEEGEDIILELSSFQLETIENFHPHISAILNIAEDHLDRYKDIKDYFNAKKNIYKNQNSKDFLILNYDNIFTNRLFNELKKNKEEKFNILTFSTKNKNATIYYNNEEIRLNIGDKIIAKGIDEYGEDSRTKTYTAVLPSDAIGEKAYDGDESTYYEENKSFAYSYVELDNSIIGKKVKVIQNQESFEIYICNENKEVINKIRLERKDVAWVGIELKGTNAIVKLVKADAKPDIINENEFCNIISNKEGVITKINSQTGTANVKVGDTVKVNDVLINGWMEGKFTGIRYVHAKGEIEAKVWYTKNKKIYYNTTQTQETGNVEKKYGLKINNFKINFSKRVSKFQIYDTIETENKFKLFSDFYLPISILKTTNKELENTQKSYDLEQAKNIGIEELQEELDKEIENKDKIVNKNINTYEDEDGVNVYVTYEVLENIGTNEKIVF